MPKTAFLHRFRGSLVSSGISSIILFYDWRTPFQFWCVNNSSYLSVEKFVALSTVFGLSFSIGVRLLVCRELSQDASNESASFARLLLRRGHLFMTPLQDRQELSRGTKKPRPRRVVVRRRTVAYTIHICTPYYMTFSTFPDAKTTFVTNICLLWLSFLAVVLSFFNALRIWSGAKFTWTLSIQNLETGAFFEVSLFLGLHKFWIPGAKKTKGKPHFDAPWNQSL